MADASWGFWRDRRTGKLWGFEHFDIVPDILRPRPSPPASAPPSPLRPSQANPALLPYLRYGRRGVDWIERNRTEFVQVATPLYAYAS